MKKTISTRRSRKEVDELIITAAKYLFLERGYRSASTKEIAAHASVAEHLIFKRFPNKAHLFVAAVVEPFLQELNKFSESWGSKASDQPIKDYLKAAYELLADNCRSLLAVTAAVMYEGEEAAQMGISNLSTEIIDELMRITRKRIPLPSAADKDRLARVLVSSLWSAAVHGGYFVPDNKRNAFINTLVDLVE